MRISIHQPNYLPYFGFFEKRKKSDIFVIYDDAQFNKEDYQRRNRIRIFNGWKWLTVPVTIKQIPINEIIIKNEVKSKQIKWSEDHLKNIHENYKSTPYYSIYESEFGEIYNNNYDKLIDLNMVIIRFIMKAFDIKTKLIFSSELGLTSKSVERLVDMVEILGGDVYLSGPKGKDYLNSAIFEERNIKVELQNFNHPMYKQRYEGFVPNMSVIDLLFNMGKWPKDQERNKCQ